MKKYTLEELTDNYIGEKGTADREQFEFELKLDILGHMIKKARKETYTAGTWRFDRGSKSSDFENRE
jgi:hypothetical protein